MKAVTEFANFTLSQALKQKAALAAEGKTAEEIQEQLGQSFKLEGEKLGYFMTALEVAASNSENLKRVMVMKLNEGEAAPSKATLANELHYVPEFHIDFKAQQAAKKNDRGGKGGRGGRAGGERGQKESPWGMSPEEKAAKLAKSQAAQAAKAAKAATKS